MIFSNKKVVTNDDISINNVCIERVYCTKFLGVFIDSKITWKEHINKLNGKLSKSVSILYRCYKLIDENALKTLYYSLFLSYVTYCCEVWGTTYKSNLKYLYKLQKKAIRIICKVEKFACTTPLFYKLGLLKLEDIVKFKCCSTMFDAYRMKLPSNLQSKFSIHQDQSNYNLRSGNRFKVSYVRTTKKQQCLSVLGVKLFNSLPNFIASLPNIHLFKKYLKIHIPEQYCLK